MHNDWACIFEVYHFYSDIQIIYTMKSFDTNILQ